MTTSASIPNITIAELQKVCDHLANTMAPKQISIEMSRETINFFIRNIPGTTGVSVGPIHPMTVLAESINIIENNEIPFGKFKETE